MLLVCKFCLCDIHVRNESIIGCQSEATGDNVTILIQRDSAVRLEW